MMVAWVIDDDNHVDDDGAGGYVIMKMAMMVRW